MPLLSSQKLPQLKTTYSSHNVAEVLHFTGHYYVQNLKMKHL